MLPWIPRFGISIHLAIDGLSLRMVVLTGLLGVLAVLCSWREIEKYQGFFHLNLMWILGGVIGVFLAIDTVSYTHLDVYKRQVLSLSCKAKSTSSCRHWLVRRNR